MERTGRDLFARYGYEPLYTPLFEHTDVFTRGIGEATDIVSKEMYTFEDRAGRSLTLRPEGTAPVVRSALQHALVQQGSWAKYYYSGPMFRYERPQKGRMRQFWQIGIELLGAGELAAYIASHAYELCDECNRRSETNPLRAFDCKNEACEEVMSDAPRITDCLCDACRTHYESVKDHVSALGIVFQEDSSLVRGLDYYTRTVFEIQAEGLGAQNAIGGGGRYDRLMEEYGGPETPGLGWALGFERTQLALESAGVEVPTPPVAEVFVARVDDSVTAEVFLLVTELRDAGRAAEADHSGKSLKAQFKRAGKASARFVVIVGPDELAKGEVTLRDMDAGEEKAVHRDAVTAALQTALRGRLDQ